MVETNTIVNNNTNTADNTAASMDQGMQQDTVKNAFGLNENEFKVYDR